MKVSAIIMFVLVSINLVRLIYSGGYNGGKVYVESNIYTIIMTSILVIILGYVSYKLKWEE